MEVLHIYMTQAQQKKMASGKTIQLTANQLSSTNGEPVEIHMLKKPKPKDVLKDQNDLVNGFTSFTISPRVVPLDDI